MVADLGTLTVGGPENAQLFEVFFTSSSEKQICISLDFIFQISSTAHSEQTPGIEPSRGPNLCNEQNLDSRLHDHTSFLCSYHLSGIPQRVIVLAIQRFALVKWQVLRPQKFIVSSLELLFSFSLSPPYFETIIQSFDIRQQIINCPVLFFPFHVKSVTKC